MLERINGARAARGLPGLRWNGALAEAAMGHARDIAAHVEHTTNPVLFHVGSDGSGIDERMRRAGYRPFAWREVTGWGFGGSWEQMVGWWLNSPNHWPILYSVEVDEAGVGYVYAPGSAWGHYWVVDFGRVTSDERRVTSGGAQVYVPVVASGAGTVDLLPYMRGEHGRQFDQGHNIGGGGTQTVQVWHLGERDWLYVKGEAGEYERLGLRTGPDGAEWIWRFEDTSEGDGRMYGHFDGPGGRLGAPWLPRFAVVGRWYESRKWVQHFRKGDCVALNGGWVVDRLRVAAGPGLVRYPQSGATLGDVVTVEWSGGEVYDFALGRGCVAFGDAWRAVWFIGDVEGRADLRREEIHCFG